MCQNLAMSQRPHKVAVLAVDGVIPFELGIPSRIFGAATDAGGTHLYQVMVCTIDGNPVTTDAGFQITVGHDARALARADTVVVPPSIDMSSAPPPAQLIAALTRLRPGTRVVSICTGAFALAAAGLLDGRTATTHWLEASALQQRFPTVCVRPDVLFVDDGAVLTSAGAAAGVDLCLHIVRRDHGSEVANRVARECVVPPWRDGGQAQYIDLPIPGPRTTSTAPTRAWALACLSEPLTLAALAAHADMSVRTFSRRFRQEVGLTPGDWLTRQRIEYARRLLETTDLPIDHIAGQSGLGSSSSLRQHLADTVGVPPSVYRRTFRAA
jgi:transcriptional regulator GlxA family with amidase domain